MPAAIREIPLLERYCDDCGIASFLRADRESAQEWRDAHNAADHAQEEEDA